MKKSLLTIGGAIALILGLNGCYVDGVHYRDPDAPTYYYYSPSPELEMHRYGGHHMPPPPPPRYEKKHHDPAPPKYDMRRNDPPPKGDFRPSEPGPKPSSQPKNQPAQPKEIKHPEKHQNQGHYTPADVKKNKKVEKGHFVDVENFRKSKKK